MLHEVTIRHKEKPEKNRFNYARTKTRTAASGTEVKTLTIAPCLRLGISVKNFYISFNYEIIMKRLSLHYDMGMKTS